VKWNTKENDRFEAEFDERIEEGNEFVYSATYGREQRCLVSKGAGDDEYWLETDRYCPGKEGMIVSSSSLSVMKSGYMNIDCT
jgi:hypothetical protein